MDILLDTNIWRYLVDADAVSHLRNAARRSPHRIVIAPGVVYEALRTGDRVLREKMIRSMAWPGWIRLMPEAYSEAMELRDEVIRVRPQWMRSPADLHIFRRLCFDWRRSRGGFWDRVIRRMDVEAEAVADEVTLGLARHEAREMREDARQLPDSFQEIPLHSLKSQPLTALEGWRGDWVDYWRINGLRSWMEALRVTDHAYEQWLGGAIITAFLFMPSADLTEFWFYDVKAEHLPRQWLRAAMSHQQRFQRTTDGTPVDQQISTYLMDVDLFLSADKNLVRIAERCRLEAPFRVARAELVSAIDAATQVLAILRMPRQKSMQDQQKSGR